MATPLRRGKPIWLARQDPNDPKLNKNYRRSVLYYRKLYAAWPDKYADTPELFKLIYKEAEDRRKAGEKVAVDHIVPICSDIVCGLHVPHNLAVITELDNLRKSNSWWPDHPFENLDLFV